MPKLIILLLLMALLAACTQSNNDTRMTEESAANDKGTASIEVLEFLPESDLPLTAEELLRIKEKLSGQIKEIEQKHSISIEGIGVGRDQIHVMVRSFGDFEKKLTKEDARQLQQSLYDYAGTEFPMKLEMSNCCSAGGSITGKITEIEDNRILVIDASKKNGNTDDPIADWITLTKDGKITRSDKGETIPFEQLTVGMTVKAWFTGVHLTSYPGQVHALKIEIQLADS